MREEQGGANEEVQKNHEFMDFLNRIEETYPVHRWIVDGVHAWPAARIHLYYSFFDFRYFAREPVRGSVFKPLDVTRVGGRISRSLAGYVRATFGDRAHRQPISAADALFLNYNTYMTLLDGSWYSRICDPLIEDLGSRGITTRMLTGGYEYSVPRYSPSAFIQPQLVLHRLAGMARSARERAPFPGLDAVEEQVVKSGLFSPAIALIGPVEATISQIRGIARYFSRLLRKVRPKLVFVTCWYSTESMACVLACHELGIPCVDIQHGSQGFHVGYVRWNRVPASGFNLLPTFFWCWGETEASAIGLWSRSLQTHQPIIGGNIFLQRWIHADDAIVHVYDKQLADVKRPWDDHVQVLYTLNGSTKDEIATLVEVVAAVNRRGFKAYFWVRLHPIALGQKSAVLAALKVRGLRNVDVENATLLPLYALLRHVDVHITEFSSVVLEAQAFGVPSVISQLGVINFPEQIASGWAVIANTVDDWVTGIQSQFERRRTLQSAAASSAASGEILDQLLRAVMKRGVR